MASKDGLKDWGALEDVELCPLRLALAPCDLGSLCHVCVCQPQFATGLWHQTCVVSRRCVLSSVRNPIQMLLQFAAMIFFGLLVGGNHTTPPLDETVQPQHWRLPFSRAVDLVHCLGFWTELNVSWCGDVNQACTTTWTWARVASRTASAPSSCWS